MDRLDRSIGWLIFGIGLLHCGITFVAFHSLSEGAMWFFSAGLAMMYCAALNLLRVRYAAVASGVRAASIAANLSLLTFIVVYAAGRGAPLWRNPGAALLVLAVALVTFFSVARNPSSAEA